MGHFYNSISLQNTLMVDIDNDIKWCQVSCMILKPKFVEPEVEACIS